MLRKTEEKKRDSKQKNDYNDLYVSSASRFLFIALWICYFCLCRCCCHFSFRVHCWLKWLSFSRSVI